MEQRTRFIQDVRESSPKEILNLETPDCLKVTDVHPIYTEGTQKRYALDKSYQNLMGRADHFLNPSNPCKHCLNLLSVAGVHYGQMHPELFNEDSQAIFASEKLARQTNSDNTYLIRIGSGLFVPESKETHLVFYTPNLHKGANEFLLRSQVREIAGKINFFSEPVYDRVPGINHEIRRISTQVGNVGNQTLIDIIS